MQNVSRLEYTFFKEQWSLEY